MVEWDEIGQSVVGTTEPSCPLPPDFSGKQSKELKDAAVGEMPQKIFLNQNLYK